MSAPRRPGGGDKKPTRPTRPGDRKPRPAGAEGERPAKPVRVRKDGTVASGGRSARQARAEGKPVRAETKPTRGRSDRNRRDDRSAATDAKPSRAREDRSDRQPRAERRAAPGDARPAQGRSGRVRPDDRSAATEGRPSRLRNGAPGGRSDTSPRAERRSAPDEAKALRGRPVRGRADDRPAPSATRPARARHDEGVAGRDRPARPPRPAGEARPARPATADARPGKAPRVRADGSVATRSAERAPKEPQRIAKLLARAGIASRREIERMIAEGRIAINGVALDTPATILTSLRGVTVDGQPVEAPSAARLFLFHKPTGFLTAERDPAGRPTIYDRLPSDLPRVIPVGRLDMNTEGLLLLTTDGGLKRQLELPSTGVPRVYRARAYGEISQDQLEGLIEGVEIDGVRYGQIDANLERRTGRNVWIEMQLREGKNREVRRVLEYLGLQVSRLIRVAYGPFVLGDLPAGEVGEVKQHELVEFRKTLK